MSGEADRKALAARNLREAIGLLMQRRGLSKGQLAEKAGLHRNTVSNILNGRLVAPPEDDTVERLAGALQVHRSLLDFSDSFERGVTQSPEDAASRIDQAREVVDRDDEEVGGQ